MKDPLGNGYDRGGPLWRVKETSSSFQVFYEVPET